MVELENHCFLIQLRFLSQMPTLPISSLHVRVVPMFMDISHSLKIVVLKHFSRLRLIKFTNKSYSNRKRNSARLPNQSLIPNHVPRTASPTVLPNQEELTCAVHLHTVLTHLFISTPTNIVHTQHF